MSAPRIEIANALVDFLNTNAYAYKFEAKRLSFPELQLKEADGVKVSVFIGPKKAEILTRARYQYSNSMYVLIQRKIDAVPADRLNVIDDLSDFTEAIQSSLEGVDLAGYSMIGYDESIEVNLFNIELMEDVGIFAAAFGLEYVG